MTQSRFNNDSKVLEMVAPPAGRAPSPFPFFFPLIFSAG